MNPWFSNALQADATDGNVLQLPRAAGVSLKPGHFDAAYSCQQTDMWFEIHPENYLMAGGPRHAGLAKVAERFPLSFHGVGASLGGIDSPDKQHLKAIAELVRRYQPVSISEHAVWSYGDGEYFADLLPLPRTTQAIEHLVNGIDAYQNAVKQRILIENPTNYLPVLADMDEIQFLLETCERAGCGLLLDINNLYLSARNTGIDAHHYIDQIPSNLVGELHIAGFDPDPAYGHALLIDSHASPVAEPVWELLDCAVAHLGPTPVLLERDANLPSFAQLTDEAQRANAYLTQQKVHHA